MSRLLILLAIGATGCYSPRIDGECIVRCDFAAAPSCPSGLTCGADNRCFAEVPCDEQPLPDGGIDASVDTTSGFCAGTGFLANTCPVQPIGPDILLPSSFNTDQDCTEILATPAGEVCMFVANSIAIATPTQVVGSRPLLLFAREAINIPVTTTLEVRAGSERGCPAVADPGENSGTMTIIAGGGPGGSFGGRGGPGGATSATRKPSNLPQTATTIRGGCSGSRGGHNSASVGGGIGGAGGGAVYFIAGAKITISGLVRAPGRGGGGAAAFAQSTTGGGGGGSGGMIVLDAPVIQINGTVHADGGGGGAGSEGVEPGGAGTAALVAGTRAMGGQSDMCLGCGDGGSGSGMLSVDGNSGGNTTSGAGGGGGGAGVIYFFGTVTKGGGALVSPVETPL